MAYDIPLALRVQQILAAENFVSKKMFGGIVYMVNGNLACGIYQENLIVRVGKERYQEALSHPMAKKFDLTSKPMIGWVEVIPAGTSDEADLSAWVRLGLEFVQTLPGKNL